MIGSKNKRRAFNLVETLVASTILSGTVLTLGAISSRALIGTRLNRQYELAATVIDRQFGLIDSMGIEEFINSNETEGDFEDFEPVYHWLAVTEYEGIDNLYLVTITVTWWERNRPYSLTAQTMLNGISNYVTTSTVQE